MIQHKNIPSGTLVFHMKLSLELVLCINKLLFEILAFLNVSFSLFIVSLALFNSVVCCSVQCLQWAVLEVRQMTQVHHLLLCIKVKMFGGVCE